MTPSEYLNRYHRLAYVLDDWTGGIAEVSRYVLGASGSVWDSRSLMLNGIAHELNSQPGATRVNAWHLPDSFVIDGSILHKRNIMHVYTGKASPDEMADVIWLAHRFGLITNPARPRRDSKSVERFVADTLGCDCNGLTGNYFGINPNTAIDSYAVASRRRRSVEDIRPGDVLISTVGGHREHIALVDSVGAGQSRGTHTVNIVEWGTQGQRNHSSSREVRFQTDSNGGGLFFEYTSRSQRHLNERGRRYVFGPPPADNAHRGYAMAAAA
jgi:hypothetical protein